MLDAADADIVLWLNDDASAHPGLFENHLRAHRDGDGPRVIAGRAIWKPIEQPDLFDQLVQQSDLIFFQQPGDPSRKTTYRNCFGLNMSFPRRLTVEAGGVPEPSEHYGYEDIELAHRLARHGAEIRTAPDAVVTHDHRYRPVDVLRREYLLGRAAWDWAGINPDFSRDLFGRDIRGDSELVYSNEVLRRERRDVERIERSFLGLAGRPAEDMDCSVLPVLAEHWVPLKRYLWRWGLIDASRGISPRWSLLAELNEPLPD